MKLNMRLRDRDIQIIQELKEKYGFTQTPELVRFLLKKEIEKDVKEKK